MAGVPGPALSVVGVVAVRFMEELQLLHSAKPLVVEQTMNESWPIYLLWLQQSLAVTGFSPITVSSLMTTSLAVAYYRLDLETPTTSHRLD